ncbi:efflux transporter outer membrane subunit [Massilia sp. GCM10020059]|uniref:Efflux transporter outer membrane subunit n=1 Tax=Massilia agrisoli TaxID=2892444 RepID=A0ABS8IV85_9BURK|nr:efflux transporter outer membrane subunit [Massilia agrisoli]MCC6071786.1 efflux transporter outer membrane subunit [Massilia agrisoli]
MLHRIVLVGAATLLSACRSVPLSSISTPGVAVPAAWSTALQSHGDMPYRTGLTAWWDNFDDPMLTMLVGQALKDNTNVMSAQAALRQARAIRDVAGAALLPALAFSSSAQQSKTGSAGANRVATAGIDASWEADLFGANRYGLRAAEASTNAAVTTLASARLSIAAEVALAYIQLRGTQARLAIARANLGSQRETLQITGWRVQAGLLTALEGEQARAASEQTEAQIPALEANIAQIAHALALLCALPPARLQAQLALARPVPQPRAGIVLSVPAETLRQRPDIATAEHQVRAAMARVDAADALRYPEFRLAGSLGLHAASLTGLASGEVARTILANVAAPLLDGGSRQAQVRAQQAALEQAQLSYREAILAALKDVEDALLALESDRKRLSHLGYAAEAAANAELLARQRYAGGVVDFQVVLDTQRSLLALQDAVASTSADFSASHVRLYKALGGGWSRGHAAGVGPDGAVDGQAQ